MLFKFVIISTSTGNRVAKVVERKVGKVGYIIDIGFFRRTEQGIVVSS